MDRIAAPNDPSALPASLTIDAEVVSPQTVPVRHAGGTVVPDWGQIPARVYTAGLSGEGQRTMTSCLQALASWLSGGRADIDSLPWAELRLAHTIAIRSALARAVEQQRFAPATANKYLAALRGTLKAAWRIGQLSTDDYLRAVDVRPIKGSRLPAGRDVAADERAAVLEHLAKDRSPAGVRDRALVALAYLSGVRRTELCSLRLDDVQLDPPALRIIGKGGRERLVPLATEAADVIGPWLSVRGTSAGPVFCPILRGGSLQIGRALTGEAFRQILRRRTLQVGGKAFSPHDLRRTYAGDLLDLGADLPTVQRLLGHASPSTTSRYDRRGERASRAAAEKLHLESGDGSQVGGGDPARPSS